MGAFKKFKWKLIAKGIYYSFTNCTKMLLFKRVENISDTLGRMGRQRFLTYTSWRQAYYDDDDDIDLDDDEIDRKC